MGIRFDHFQNAKTALMVLTPAATDTVIKAAATLSSEKIARMYITPGFNGSLEWLEASLSFAVAVTTPGVTSGTIITAKWQIRTRGEASFTDIGDAHSTSTYPGDGIGSIPSTTATSGGAGTITVTAAGWTVNAYAGMSITVTAGTGAGTYTVISNTADTLTLNTTTTFNNTSVFNIGTSTAPSKTFALDVVHDAIAATTDTTPLELQLIVSTSTSIGLTFTLTGAAMAVRCVGESV